MKNGLLAVWGFDSFQPETFNDTSGNSSHASIFGNVVRNNMTSGPVGHTATFQNNSDYLKGPLNSNLDTGNGSVAFWFKGSPSDGERMIFSRDYGRFPMLFVSYAPNNVQVIENGRLVIKKLGFFRVYSGVPFVNSPVRLFRVDETNPALSRIDDGKWHHVVISATGTSVQLSVDGVSASPPQQNAFALFSEPNVAGAPSNPTGESGFYIGALSSRYVALGALTSMNATIDQFLIYNRALSKTEAAALYRYDSDGDSLSNIIELETTETDPFFFNTISN